MPISRFALATAVVAAISVLFAFASPAVVPAQAEAIDGVAATAPDSAVETPLPAEPAPAPASPPELATGTEPVEVPEAAPATESAGAAVESAPAASPPSSIPSSVPSSAATATPAEVKVPAETEPDGSTAPALLQHVSSQATGIREGSARPVEEVIDRPPPVHVPAPLKTVHSALPQVPGVERLPEVGLPEATISMAAEVTRSIPLLGRVTSAAMEELLPSAGELLGTDRWTSRGEVSSLPAPTAPAGLFPQDPIGVQDSPFVKGLTGFDDGEPLWLVAWAPLSDAKKPLAVVTLVGANRAYLSADLGRSPDGIAPLDRPLPPIPPIPGSPGAAVPGSAGSFFVPLAALLALLALVAPANFRRRREAPDFRPPTPFVCALERPG